MKLLVATHKPYPMPDGPAYLPIHVGAAGKPPIGFARDDEGDNISARNASFCELTGLYWAWKNLPGEDAIGLLHYRRHFRATPEEIADALEKFPCVLPKPRNYFIETTYSQYVHAHHAADLDTTRAILAERHPGFLDAFDATMRSTRGHRFNMLVMRKEQLNAYCQWLFDILFETEKRLGTPAPRMMGYLSERLLDAWILTERMPYRELRVYHTEKENWLVKGGAFLLRKIRGAKA